MIKVLVASPVRQKPNILGEFLWALERLDTTGLALEFAFIDDHSRECSESTLLLQRFAARQNNVCIIPSESTGNYTCDENTHHWREDLIWKVAAFKDQFISMAREKNMGYLFLVDSDLVLHPKTITHLVGLGKDIVSEVFWTRWAPELEPLPQVWVADSYSLHHQHRHETPGEKEICRRAETFLNMLKQPGTYKVGGLGACTLISHGALDKGVSFSEIYNLSFAGEDRHFCIRATALGLELYADTHYPPYHIYRESELPGVEDFKNRHFLNWRTEVYETKKTHFNEKVNVGGKDSLITLAMLVRNESCRYLERILGHAAQYIDRAVILDDASEDSTVDICRDVLAAVPLTLVSNRTPSFDNEIKLRKQLWELTLQTDPEWILCLDADELFEDRAVDELPRLAFCSDAEAYLFRLYDFWDEDHYREDDYWRAHLFYRPFMVRPVSGFDFRWRETPQHCGRLPANITELRCVNSDLRIKHLGWAKPADRLAKYRRYKKLDPGARYGIAEQYLSILDPRPQLIVWEECSNVKL